MGELKGRHPIYPFIYIVFKFCSFFPLVDSFKEVGPNRQNMAWGSWATILLKSNESTIHLQRIIYLVQDTTDDDKRRC